MIDFVVGAIILLIVGSALAYIIRSRKNGIKCIGCPDAKTCSSGCHSSAAAGGCDGKSCAGCHANAK